MTLQAYLEANNLNPTRFAKLHHFPRAVVYRWVNGTIPHGRNLAKLTKATGGAVTLDEMLAEGKGGEPVTTVA